MLSVLILLSVGILLWFIYDKKRCADYPPGPIRIPIFGCLLTIAKLSPYPHVAFQKLAKVYGDVIFVRMGFTEAVICNSLETSRDILNHENTTDRTQTMVPIIWERMSYKNLGLIFSNKKVWQTLRRFTLRTLRDFGFGKSASMDVVINEELEKFTDYLKTSHAQNPNGIDQAHILFDLTIVNVLWRLVTGTKYELNDSKMLRLLQLNHDLLQTTNFAVDYAIAFPQLYHMFPKSFGKTDQQKCLNNLFGFVRETIEHHRGFGDYLTSPNCYVDEFLSQIEKYKDDPNTEYTEEQLVLCLMDLFQAGSDTTSNTLSFAMLYMILHPEIQGKVQSEIDMNVDRKECIMLSTKDRLPYTHATLLECLRHSAVVPTPAARQATKDFYFNGHFIKKGMALMPNIYSTHFSESIWGDPYNFRPERFLNGEGEVDGNVANYLLTFGHGSRKCLATSLAENSLFLYFATILRGFNVLKVKASDNLSKEQVMGITMSPKPYRARYVPRT